MWLITGPFDSATIGDETSTKTKLLKPATTYDVGRHKENALFINSKKISRQNGEITLGEHTEEDATNPAAVPTLSFRNTKSAIIKVDRGSDIISINPGMVVDLESGDIIHFSGSLIATHVLYKVLAICFYVEGQDFAPDIAVCASFGIKLVTKHIRDVNYHLTTNITVPLSPPVLLSLLNLAHFVTPNWLAAMTDLSLTQTYTPPNTTKFLPTIEPALSQTHPVSTWQPSKPRRSIFNGIRFIFAVIGSGIGTETKAISDVATRGGGDRQLINVEKEAEGKSAWDSALKKRRTILREGMKSGLVLVGDSEAMLARGVPKATRTAWEGMVEKARDAGMRIIPPSLINEAILTANPSLLDCTVEGEVAAPPSGVVPTAYPGEPSQSLSSAQSESQPPEEVTRPARRLTRRATSQTPAPVPATAPEVEAASTAMEGDVRVVVEPETSESQGGPRKKPLKRRAKTGGLINTLLGLDDGDTSMTALNSAQAEEVREKSVPVPPTPGSRTSRLKRRAGTAGTQPLDPLTQDEENSFGVQRLKKFKALFEESGQGRMSGMEEEEEEGASFPGVSTGFIPGDNILPPLREVEEEPQEPQAQAQKRKADAMDIDEAPSQAEAVEAAKKKRAVEGSNEVERSQEPKTFGGSSKAKGAAPGKPDTDPSFLRALASLKRGKRTEDTFDREFNQLRIAKPDIRNIDNAQASSSKVHYDWEGLDDFEKDVGIRGNFMQIVEMEVWKDKHASVDDNRGERFMRRESGVGGRLDWDGREDFKKFKRRGTNRDREIVPVVLHKPEGYEPELTHMDFNYGQHTRTRKDARSFDDVSDDRDNDDGYPTFTQPHPSRTKSQPKPRPHAKPPSRPKPTLEEINSSEAEEEIRVTEERPAVDDSRQAAAEDKSKSKVPRPTRASTTKKFQPLFDPDSEEEEIEAAAASALLAGTADTTQDMDLTLGTNLPSQVTTRRGTKRKVMAAIQESDSGDDDGMTFGGFSKKPAKRRK
ncbi:hypothetical protein BU17DRAFT_59893 [Hysterangium stoloniferum]|nr:hypothetical protein BU17DRAFT_59893 [Hysterangium stoloniferum]